MIVTRGLSSGSRRRPENGFVDFSVWKRNEFGSRDLSVTEFGSGSLFSRVSERLVGKGYLLFVLRL